MFESTAVWAEEKVFPDVDDYLNYVRVFATLPGRAADHRLPAGRRKSLKIYGSAVWNHWLDTGGGGYGVDVIRRAWEVSDVAKPRRLLARRLRPRDRATAAGAASGASSPRFAAATAEWRTGLGEFPDHAAYPDVKRKGVLHRGSHDVLRARAHRLSPVPGQAGRRRPQLMLRLNVDAGVRAAARARRPRGRPAERHA